MSLATGLQVRGVASWAQLACQDALLKLAPALAMAALISAVMHRVRSALEKYQLLFVGVLERCSWWPPSPRYAPQVR